MQPNALNQLTRPRHDFRILESVNHQYYWVYYDGNYEPLVTSEMYTRREDAQRGLNNFISEMAHYYRR